MTAAAPWPTELRVGPGGSALSVSFENGERFELPAPLLRAMTPSAADRGHGGPSFAPVSGISPGVRLTSLAPVGRYAVRIGFDDGHDSGLYSWERLHRIGVERERLEAGG